MPLRPNCRNRCFGFQMTLYFHLRSIPVRYVFHICIGSQYVFDTCSYLRSIRVRFVCVCVCVCVCPLCVIGVSHGTQSCALRLQLSKHTRAHTHTHTITPASRERGCRRRASRAQGKRFPVCVLTERCVRDNALGKAVADDALGEAVLDAACGPDDACGVRPFDSSHSRRLNEGVSFTTCTLTTCVLQWSSTLTVRS